MKKEGGRWVKRGGGWKERRRKKERRKKRKGRNEGMRGGRGQKINNTGRKMAKYSERHLSGSRMVVKSWILAALALKGL